MPRASLTHKPLLLSAMHTGRRTNLAAIHKKYQGPDSKSRVEGSMSVVLTRGLHLDLYIHCLFHIMSWHTSCRVVIVIMTSIHVHSSSSLLRQRISPTVRDPVERPKCISRLHVNWITSCQVGTLTWRNNQFMSFRSYTH